MLAHTLCVMYEGGNDIACSGTTQDLLRQKNCDFIPAQCSLTSSFKLLMSFFFFVQLLLFDIRFRDTKRTLLNVSPHLGQA